MTTKRTLADLDGDPTAVVFPGAEPKTVRLTLDEGERVAPHRHPDRQVVLAVLDGRLTLDVGDETRTVEAGETVRFDGRQEVSPFAETDVTALLVLARRVPAD
ncbi:cupin [halophilic archaeon]|nr:cupin [halophilic archaeon]